MTESEIIRTLMDALKFYRENFISSSYSTMGFTIVAVGWLITSKSAQDFFRSHRRLSVAAIAMLIVSFIAYWRLALGVWALSHAIAEKLSTHIERSLFQYYELSSQGVYGFILLQGLATAFIILLIVSIINEPAKTDSMGEIKTSDKGKRPAKK